MASDSVSLLDVLMQNRDLPQSRFCIVRPEGMEFSADMPARGTAARSKDVFAVYSRGIPWVSEECSRRWIGDRLLCFPDGIPDLRRISIVSSRLRQRLDQELWWFDLLRTLVLQCDPQSEAIVTAAETTACAAALRAARLFGRPVIHFHLPGEAQGSRSLSAEWLQLCQQQILVASAGRIPDFCRVFVSPEWPMKPGDSEGRETSTETPLGDRVLIAASSRIYALSIRPKGMVSRLVENLLKDSELSTRPLLLACNDKGELPSVAESLPLGWVAWLLQPFAFESTDSSLPTRQGPALSTSEGRVSADPVSMECDRSASQPVSDPDGWLLHWTRAKAGPWPGESPDDFLDALILQTEAADHSALATLLRIIANRRLAASSEGIRGGHAVVSFTAVSLSEFRDRRVFRKHRHRYDFEPWGIGVSRDALARLGARPVMYGQADRWLSLNPEDRVFFQKATVEGATNNCAEQEWRVVGDVDLSQFPDSAVCVFADNDEAAAVIRRHTAWRVIVTPGLRES